MRAGNACSRAAWDFSRVEEVWARFLPLTPAGKDEKEARRVLSDRASIEASFDDIEAGLSFLDAAGGGSPLLSRVSYHLKRVPRIPTRVAEEGEAYELVELFLVKKFIANYRAVISLAGAAAAAYFGLEFGAEALAAELDLGGSDAETFFVADAYDARLAEARRRVAAIDARVAEGRAAALERAAGLHGLAFGGRDFAVVTHQAAKGILEDRASFAVEPYDDKSYIVRLQPGEAELALADERDAALEAEKAAEAAVLVRLSALVAAELDYLAGCVKRLARFDLALARAAMARELGLVRPVFGEGGNLLIEGGCYLPCAWECRDLGLRYLPLDLELAEGAAVIFGSNMGGKTVALETVLFFQVLAQAGFFVPATRYSTSVYPLLHYVGDGQGRGGRGRSEGLSGFGYEIRSFVDAWEGSAGGALLVFDEFARTTSSHEAEAILSAVIESLAGRAGTRALFSTHFRGVSRIPGVRYLRVRGLDREAAAAALAAAGSGEACDEGAAGAAGAGQAEDMGERIRRINGMMRYGLVDEAEDGEGGSDAVAIASLLGLDPCLVARAEELYEGGRLARPPATDTQS
jgi:hypothetical protein